MYMQLQAVRERAMVAVSQWPVGGGGDNPTEVKVKVREKEPELESAMCK